MIHDRHEQWQHDQARDAYLTQQGIRVVRLSNDRIVAETETVGGDCELPLSWRPGK